MVLRLKLPPETEAKLRRRAASARKDLEAVVLEVLEDQLAGTEAAGDAEGPATLSAAEWAAELDAWAASHPPCDWFVDDSRESIYAGRGE